MVRNEQIKSQDIHVKLLLGLWARNGIQYCIHELASSAGDSDGVFTVDEYILCASCSEGVITWGLRVSKHGGSRRSSCLTN